MTTFIPKPDGPVVVPLEIEPYIEEPSALFDLMDLLAELPDRNRDIFQRWLYGCPTCELAVIFEITPVRVNQIIQWCRQFLKNVCRERGRVCNLTEGNYV